MTGERDKTKEIFSILILCGLLFGCGVSDAPTSNETAVFSAGETEEGEEEEGREITEKTVDIFPITEKDCQEMKQKQEKGKTLIVEKGTALTGKEKVEIPVIDRPSQYIPISEFDVDAVAAAHSSRKEKGELWGFTDMAEVGAYLGEKFLQDFAEDQEDGWKADRQYECFHVSSNEAAGYLHLQYYFYPEKNEEKRTKAKIMVADVFLSEEGIAKTEINELCEEQAGGCHETDCAEEKQKEAVE